MTVAPGTVASRLTSSAGIVGVAQGDAASAVLLDLAVCAGTEILGCAGRCFISRPDGVLGRRCFLDQDPGQGAGPARPVVDTRQGVATPGVADHPPPADRPTWTVGAADCDKSLP